MASNFIPMLSSSPPPLDDCPDNDDEDEEFGNFASANIPFDSSFDEPNCGDKSFKSDICGPNVVLNNHAKTFGGLTNSTLNVSKNHTHDSLKENQNHKDNTSDDLKSNHSRQSSSSDELHISSNGSSLNSTSDMGCSALNTIEDPPDNHLENNFSEDRLSPACSNEENSLQNNAFCDIRNSKFNILNKEELSKNMHVLDKKNHLCHDNDLEHSANQNSNWSSNSDDCSDIDRNYSVNSHSKSVDCEETENSLFPAQFPPCENLDEFDDFQSVDAPSKLESVKNDVMNAFETKVDFTDNAETFEADFEDFQHSDVILTENCNNTNGGPPSGSEKGFGEPETFEADFGNFQENQLPKHSENDDFDDFQSFSKADAVDKNEFRNVKSSSDIDIDDDFDDFQDCGANSAANEDFAAFEEASFNVDDSTKEFANFETASFKSTSGDTSVKLNSLSQDKGIEKISTVVKAIFPSMEDSDDELCSSVPEIIEQSNKSRRLWEKLQEMEPTPGVRFQWGVSHSFQQLLRSVNVDYHSILRTSSVPIFASGLSLLEPVKGITSSANTESDDRIQSPKDPIPPVQFDWNTSGLINPLDSGQITSTLMDLSFLSSTANSPSVSKRNSLEDELLKPSPIPSASDNSSGPFLLEELLSKGVCSFPVTQNSHQPQNVSQETTTILDQLPDLSFMRAKVLMFPISKKT